MRTNTVLALLAALAASGCFFPGTSTGSASGSGAGTVTGSTGDTAGGSGAGTVGGSGAGSTTSQTGRQLCDPCGSSAECQSGLCDRASGRCQPASPCGGAGACQAAGLRCDAVSGNCLCAGGSGTSGSTGGGPDGGLTTGGPGGTSGGCGADEQLCGGRCVNVLGDPGNCGRCGFVCPTGACVNGQCGCAGGQQQCGPDCVDTQTDVNNCGSCGNHCPSGSCVAGQCSCPGGQQICDFRCVNTQTDPGNCGSCGNRCMPPLSACNAGQCACQTGTTLCGANCVDTLNDSNNCGGCGQFCGSGARCANGQCACFNSSDLLCGNSCYPANDNAHCGSCGNACPVGTQCQAGGTCVCFGPNQLLCGSTCVSYLSDPSHCGDCQTACGGGQTCQNGQCACTGGQALCASGCADLQGDAANCGACGHSCGGGACQAGKCQPAPVVTGQYFPTQVALTDNFLFFADRNNNVQRAARDGSGLVPFASGLGAVAKIVGAGGTVLFQAGSTVYAAPEGQAPGAAATPVLTGFNAWTADATGLYWLVAGSACTCTSTGTSVGCDPSNPVACDNTCSCATPGTINRAALDGTGAVLLASSQTVGGADNLAVGPGGVYWTRLSTTYGYCPGAGTSFTGELDRVAASGGAPQQVGTFNVGYTGPYSGWGVFLGPNNAYVRGMSFVGGGCNTTSDFWYWLTATGGTASSLGNASLRDLAAANGQIFAGVNNTVITFPDNAPTGGSTTVYTSASSTAKASLASDGAYLYFADDSNGTIYRLAL